MSRRVYEKTQNGNPYQLPIRGHVFPAAGICRFTDRRGLVEVFRRSSGDAFKASPTNPVFCAMRAWDKRSETAYKDIEQDFQELAAQISDGRIVGVSESDKPKVDSFFALWKVRAIFREKVLTAAKINGISGENITKDQEERLEELGVLFVRQGGTMPAHRFNGVQIQTGIMQQVAALTNIRWNIVHAAEGQFIVPDFPATTLIPIKPDICLCGTPGELVQNGHLLKTTVVELNRHVATHSKEYYFAQDLQACF